MNIKRVLSTPATYIATPRHISDMMVNRYFNGRNGTETRISREDLAALLQGAAEIALKHCRRE